MYNTQSIDIVFFFLHYGKETENEEERAHTKKLGDKENIEKLPDNSGLWTSLRLKTNSWLWERVCQMKCLANKRPHENSG